MSLPLLRLSLRLASLPSLAVVGAIVTIMLLLESIARRTAGDPGVHIVTQTVFACLLLWSGFLAGARPFSREFRERHFLLVQVLPVTRPSAWTAIMVGAFIAGLGSVSLAALLLRPSIVSREEPIAVASPVEIGIVLLTGYLVLFAAGSCYALLFHGTAVHAVGLVATFATLAEAIVLLANLYGDPRSPFGAAGVGPGAISLPTAFRYHASKFLGLSAMHVGLGGVLVCGTMALVFYLGFSLLFFVRGEFPVARVRWMNAVGLVTGHFFFFVAAAAFVETWARTRPFVVEKSDVALEPGGAHIAVVERRRGFPRLARLRLIESHSGRVQRAVEVDGLREMLWAPASGGLMLALTDMSPWRRLGYLLPPSGVVWSVGVDGGTLSFERFPPGETVEWLVHVKRSLVAVVRSGLQVRIVELTPPRRSSGVLRFLGEDLLQFLPLVDGTVFVAARADDGPLRLWLLHPRAEELPRAVEWTSGLPPPMIFGDSIVTSADASAAIARQFPLPASVTLGGAPPRYLTWAFAERPGWVFAIVPHFRGATRDVWARNPQDGIWRVAARGLRGVESPEQARLQSGLPAACVEDSDWAGTYWALWVCRNGSVISRPGGSLGDWVVHDARTGREHRVRTESQERLTPQELPSGSLALLIEHRMDYQDLLRTLCEEQQRSPSLGRGDLSTLRAAAGCGPVTTRLSYDRALVLSPGAPALETYALNGPTEHSSTSLLDLLDRGGLAYYRVPTELREPSLGSRDVRSVPVTVIVARQAEGGLSPPGHPRPADRQLWPVAE